MQIVWEQRDNPTGGGDLYPFGQTVRRGPGIAIHTGRQVRDGYFKKAKGSGPQSDFKINELEP